MATTVLGLKTFAASDPVDYNEINDNYNKIDNGVKTALQGRAAHNLLDNSNFRNPVNQRGIQSGASITEYTYCLDRWMNFDTTAGTLTLSENGISFTMTNFNQRLPETIKTGTVVTAAAKWNDGTVVTVTGAITRGNAWTWFTAANNGHQIGVIDMGNNKEAHFTIMGGSGVVEWAALYEGSYTADTLPAYQPKGYAAELAECQRYYREVYRVFGKDLGNVTREAIILNPPMRIPPTSTVKSLWKGNDDTSVTVSSTANDNADVTYTGWGNLRLSLSADL